MPKAKPRLRLGKSLSFVKTHLKLLPIREKAWEVDFRAMPTTTGRTEPGYLGLVVALPEGDPLAYLPLDYTLTLHDLADLLAGHAPAHGRAGPWPGRLVGPNA
jgi:hypothetical protein